MVLPDYPLLQPVITRTSGYGPRNFHARYMNKDGVPLLHTSPFSLCLQFSDLDRLLYVYKAWANRVLPKLRFDGIIERLERVGSRNEIQGALRRMREGTWPLTLSDEFVHNSDDDSNDEEGGTVVGVSAPDEEERMAEDEADIWERALNAMPVSSGTLRSWFSLPMRVVDG